MSGVTGRRRRRKGSEELRGYVKVIEMLQHRKTAELVEMENNKRTRVTPARGYCANVNLQAAGGMNKGVSTSKTGSTTYQDS